MTTVAETYIEDVLAGRIPAGPWIIKAFQRHRRDLENCSKRGLFFDPAAGQDVIDFCQSFCVPSNQEEYIRLTPWQHAILYITYGWKRADGSRRFRRTYVEIAKKNGKTALAAALSHYHLIADGEPSPRVFIAATTGKQAKICMTEAVAMREKSPDLRAAIHQSGTNPVIALYTDNLGRLSMMARDAASEDGAMVSCAILDELHRWKKGAGIYSVLKYGGRNRRQPLMIELTTAGASADGTSMCWEEREYGTKILDGALEDDEFAPWIFCMDDKDDWRDPRNWVKSNPSLGYLFDEERIAAEWNEAQGKPAELGEFKRFALNIWSKESEDPAIEIEKWDLCCREDLTKYPDKRRMRREALEALKGRLCFGGLDLAPKNDTSAFVLLFPPIVVGEKWEILEWFWCPKDNIAARKKRDKVDYDVWDRDGFIVTTPGNSTDPRYISDAIAEINKQYNLKEVYFDPAWSGELIRMIGEDHPDIYPKFVDKRQGPLEMNGPCLEFMRKVIRQEFRHSANPVMRWQMGNLRWAVQKNTGFIRPSRDRKREKIDGCSSLIMALACATSLDNIVKPKAKMWAVTVDTRMKAPTSDLEKQFPGVNFD
jgi:phage terminase large subunit-like protein